MGSKKISEDDLLKYQEFLDSGYVKTVLVRLNALLGSFEKNLLTVDTNSPTLEKDLLVRKLELQGAQKLLKAFELDSTKLKNKPI